MSGRYVGSAETGQNECGRSPQQGRGEEHVNDERLLTIQAQQANQKRDDTDVLNGHLIGYFSLDRTDTDCSIGWAADASSFRSLRSLAWIAGSGISMISQLEPKTNPSEIAKTAG